MIKIPTSNKIFYKILWGSRKLTCVNFLGRPKVKCVMDEGKLSNGWLKSESKPNSKCVMDEGKLSIVRLKLEPLIKFYKKFYEAPEN